MPQNFLRRTGLAALLAAVVVAASGVGAAAQSLVRDAEIERTLRMLSAPIFRAAGLAPESINILILNQPELNAFVFGGRNMVFNTGLLIKLDRPEELMGVMAHETGHITGGHLARRAINAEMANTTAMIGTALAVLAGAASGNPSVAVAGALGAQSAAERTFLSYTRAEEAAADQAGVSYMERVGIDPGGIVDVLDIFRGQEVFSAANVDPYALTHPLSSERIQLLQDRVARSPVAGRPAPDDMVYWHTRMRAKLAAFLNRPDRTLSLLETTEYPNNEINVLQKAIALHLLPKPDEALATVDRLLEARPNDPYYWELKGQILFESGRGAEAVAPLERAVALAPEEPLIRGSLGRALLALNDPARNAEALATLEEATRNDSSEPAVLRDLALAYARAGDEGRAALATAERYAIQGDPREALRHSRRALDQLPYGSPGWLKADDIRAVAERTLRDN